MAPASRDRPDAEAAETETSGSVNENLAQALRDLDRGEQAAAAIESSLAALEVKLDQLLAEATARDPEQEQNGLEKGAHKENPHDDKAP